MKLIENEIASEYKDNFFFEPIKFGESITKYINNKINKKEME